MNLPMIKALAAFGASAALPAYAVRLGDTSAVSQTGADEELSVKKIEQVLIDIDGTVTIYHPEQNKPPEPVTYDGKNFKKETSDFEKFAVQALPDEAAQAGLPDKIFSGKFGEFWPTGDGGGKGKAGKATPGLPASDPWMQALQKRKGVRAKMKKFIFEDLKTAGVKSTWWVAPAKGKDWSDIKTFYEESLKSLFKSEDVGMPLEASTKWSQDGGEEDEKMSKAKFDVYAKKVNAIRNKGGCSFLDKCGPSGDYQCTPKPDACDLSKILVVDDCPFTMNALRVLYKEHLPGLQTFFVNPHLSLAFQTPIPGKQNMDGIDAVLALLKEGPEAIGTVKELDGAKVIEQEVKYMYKQYASPPKPQQGTDVVGPEVYTLGQAIYVQNPKKEGAKKKDKKEGDKKKVTGKK